MGKPSPVVVAFVTFVICMGTISGVVIHAAVNSVEESTKPLRPQFGTYAPDCSEFVVEYDEEDWNEVTETYPTNHAWQDCMGVGSK